MKTTRLACLCGALLALLALPAFATTLSFAAPAAAVPVGAGFAVDVLVTDAADLYAWQFDIAFDPTLVQASAVLEGDLLSAGGGATSFLPGSIDNLLGTVSFTANTLTGPGPGATGNGVVAHLSFQALAPGQGALSFSNVVLLDSALGEITTTALGSTFTVAAVPEPASAALMVLGLAGLAGFAALQRRRPRIGG
ncbi:MAG TPA: cohesin domain-containing protein [Roseateles sp.]|nr:cohesin domain-containing protein [Roseateles sp.]